MEYSLANGDLWGGLRHVPDSEQRCDGHGCYEEDAAESFAICSGVRTVWRLST